MVQRSKEVTHAIFLAGGQGKRIYRLTAETKLPKQLLVVANISSLDHGINTIASSYPDAIPVVVSSPLWVDLFKKRFPSCQVLVQSQPRGNADALRIAVDNITDGHNVLCFNSDHLIGLGSVELRGLVRTHFLNNFAATILLETASSNEPTKFLWEYDNTRKNLKGRRTSRTDRSPYSGKFIGAFVAQLNWLRAATTKESQIAASLGTESKTTDMLLRDVNHTRIGVFCTNQKHWGINTPEEYHTLQRLNVR